MSAHQDRETKRPGGFRLSATFWQAVEADPVVREELERLVEARLQTRVARAVSEAEHEARARGLEDGLRRGMEQGIEEGARRAREAWESAKSTLDRICSDLLDDRLREARAQKDSWGRALSHVLKRLLTPRAAADGNAVLGWLDEALARYAEAARVRIRVSADLGAPLKGILAGSVRPGWEIVEDTTLGSGVILCECEDGGIVFSKPDELARLEQILDSSVAELLTAQNRLPAGDAEKGSG